MANQIPPPSILLDGAFILYEKRHRGVLIIGDLPEKPLTLEVFRGEIAIRHALTFIYEPDAFYIQRIVDDFGRDFRGEEALDFANRKGDAFPRASVFGVRASTGIEEQIFLKQLDLARWIVPIAYAGTDTSESLGQIHAVVRLDTSLSQWQPLESSLLLDYDPLADPIPSYISSPTELSQLEQHLFG